MKTEGLEYELSVLSGKRHMLAVAKTLCDKDDGIKTLMSIVAKGSPRLSWRAAWIIENLFYYKPESLNDYFDEMLKILLSTQCDGVRRHILKIFGMIAMEERWVGQLAQLCFSIVPNQQRPVAVRVYGMQILYNISCLEPELRTELLLLLHGNEFESPGVKSKKAKLSKMIMRDIANEVIM